MKATLEFNLNDFDDRIAHSMCINAPKMQCIIWDLDQWLSEQIKYNPDNKEGDILTGYETARNKLKGIMEENDLTFDNEIFT